MLLFINRTLREEEAWLLPYPSGTPRRILQSLAAIVGTPQFSWMPDSRHIVMSFSPSRDTPSHLWMADTASDSYWALTTGNRSEVQPAVSPDGNKIVYTAVLVDFDLVEAPLDGSPPRTLLSTSRWEAMPAWSSAHEQFVYVTNRSGPEEIWLKSQREGWTRPLVTARDFPNAATRWFMAPVFSPDGTRIAYTRVGTETAAAIWITPISGGSPVRLTTESATEFPPA